jgi:hypothetical protein
MHVTFLAPLLSDQESYHREAAYLGPFILLFHHAHAPSTIDSGRGSSPHCDLASHLEVSDKGSNNGLNLLLFHYHSSILSLRKEYCSQFQQLFRVSCIYVVRYGTESHGICLSVTITLHISAILTSAPDFGLITTKSMRIITVNTVMLPFSVGTISRGCTCFYCDAILHGASLHMSTKKLDE